VERSDIVVVGGGIIGMCVAAALAPHHDVVLLERAVGADATGASRGTARFRQLENVPDDSYLALGVRARRAWAPFEAVTSSPIFTLTGNLSVGEADALARFASALRAHGLPCEEVTGGEVAMRWPILRSRDDDVLFQPDGEVIAAAIAHRAATALATQRGTKIRRGCSVLGVEAGDDDAVIRTDTGELRSRRVVLAAGPWIAPIAASAGIQLPVFVTRQTVAWFAPPGGAFPTVTDWSGREPYLLADAGVKAAEHERGPVTDPNDDGMPDPASVARLETFVAGWFAEPLGDPAVIETCLYTNAPDDRFLIERRGSVLAVSACSGHAFQYAPAVADDVADAVETSLAGAG
jgi:sarcosine oxidase